MIQTIVVGFIVGLCISYSGVGAGSLTTPLIVLLLGYDASTAIGSDLLFSLGTKLVALVTHLRARTVNYAALLWLSIGGVPGAILGLFVTGWLHAHLSIGSVDRILKVALAIALLVAAGAVLLGRMRDGASAEARIPRLPLVATGFVVAALVSITSIGSGSLMLPMLMLVASQARLRTLVGTDVAFAVVILIPALAGHFAIGDVNVRLGAVLLAGSIPGVLLGARLVRRVPERVFRAVLALMLAIVALRLVLWS